MKCADLHVSDVLLAVGTKVGSVPSPRKVSPLRAYDVDHRNDRFY